MKRLVLMLFGLLMLTVSAANAEKYTAEANDKTDYIVAAEFSDGLLYNIQKLADKENGRFEFESNAEKIRVYAVSASGIEEIDVQKKSETTEESEETGENEVIEETGKPEFPEVYEIEKDANRAVMIVKSVSGAYVNEENVCELKVLFHGEELVYHIAEETALEAVPEAYADLKGENVYSLKKGDIVKINTQFSGKIKSVDLIFRPTADNPIFEEDDFGKGFLKLFSYNGIVAGEASYKAVSAENQTSLKGYSYAFGIICDYNAFELTLSDKDGSIITIDVNPKAICYEVDREERFEPNTAVLSAVRRGSAARNAVDDEDNFTGWSEKEGYNYAFVRMIDGEATEIVLYQSY